MFKNLILLLIRIKMNKDRVENYNEHAKFLADIALDLLTNNGIKMLNINGVREIIALYLLIPYITRDKLEKPSDECNFPTIEGQFCDSISLKDLRDSLCHSFVTVEEDKNDGTRHGKYLILDDRVLCDRKTHESLESNSKTANIDIEYANKKLIELFNEVKSYTPV
jgi:hypothetical protein